MLGRAQTCVAAETVGVTCELHAHDHDHDHGHGCDDDDRDGTLGVVLDFLDRTPPESRRRGRVRAAILSE